MIGHPFKKPYRGTPLIIGHPLKNGLIACYPCNEYNGEIVHDYSDLRQHLTRASSASWDQYGVYGYYWSTSSGAIYPTSNNNATLLAIAYKNTTNSGADCIFSFGTTNTANVSYLGQNSSEEITAGATGLGTTINSNYSFAVRHRYVIMATIVGNTYRLYVNGHYIAQDSFSTSRPSGGVIAINRLGTGTSFYWDRRTECAMLWERALTDEEVFHISQDPYQIFKTSRLITSSGTPTFTVQDSTHAHSADNVVLTADNPFAYIGNDDTPANGGDTSSAGYSYIYNEQAIQSGYITEIEVYINTAGTLDFAVFNRESGDNFIDEHAVLGLPATGTGYRIFRHIDNDFNAYDLPIDTNQYIGWYQNSSGLLDKTTSGGPGYWYDNGDQIGSTPASSTFAYSTNTTHNFEFRARIDTTPPFVVIDSSHESSSTTITLTVSEGWVGTFATPSTPSGTSTADYTYIYDSASEISGYVTKIEIYADTVGDLDFAVFRQISGNDFSDDHAVQGLSVSSGLNEFTHENEDFDAADLPIDSGEYIGWWQASNGLITKRTTNGPGYRYVGPGDNIDATASTVTFTTSGNNTHDFQIRAYIEPEVPGQAIQLTVQNAEHDHSTGSPTLSVHISPNDSTHSSTADAISLSQHNVLSTVSSHSYHQIITGDEFLGADECAEADCGFEDWTTDTDLTEWGVAVDGSMAKSTDKHSGSFALELTTDDGYQRSYVLYNGFYQFTAVSGQLYKYGGWVKVTDNPSQYGVAISYLGSGSGNTPWTTSSSWIEVSNYFSASGDNPIALFPYSYNDYGTPGQIALFDDIWCKKILPVPLTQHNVLVAQDSTHSHEGFFELSTEHILNTGLEDNIDYWFAAFGSSTIEQSSDQAHSDTYSLKNVTTATNRGGFCELSEAFETGKTYRLDCWVYPTMTTSIQYDLYSGTLQSLTTATGLTVDAWNHVIYDFDSDADYVAYLYFRSSASGTVYHDDYSLKELLSVPLAQHNVLEIQGSTHPHEASIFLGSELIDNGDMEIDDKWIAWGTPTTCEQSSDYASSGTYSWKVTVDGFNHGLRYDDTFSMENGENYKINHKLYSPAGINFYRFYIYNGTDNLIIVNDATNYPADQWHSLETYFEWIHPTDSNYYLYNAFLVTLSGYGTIYFDDISLKKVIPTLITQHNVLLSQDSEHNFNVDSPTLSVNLEVNNVEHTHSSDSPGLTQHNILASQDSEHIHKSVSFRANLIVNGNMETGDPPTGWTYVGVGSRQTDERTGGSGTYCLNVLESTATFLLGYQNITVVDGKTYWVSGWTKAVNGGGSIVFATIGGNEGSSGAIYSTTWTYFEFDVEADGTSLDLTLYCNFALRHFRFDDIEVREVTSNIFLSVNLEVDNCEHTHSSDSPDLTQYNILVSQNAEHAHIVTSPDLAQHNILVSQNTEHIHSVENLYIGLSVDPENATHAHTSGSPNILYTYTNTTGWKYPGSVIGATRSGASVSWYSHSWASAEDNYVSSTDVIDKQDYTHWLRAYNFGFSSEIPSNSRIDGIEAQIKRAGEITDVIKDSAVYLHITGTVSGNNKASFTLWTNNLTWSVIYGTSSDTWQSSYNREDIANTGFGFQLSAYNSDFNNEYEARVDSMRLRVTYTDTNIYSISEIQSATHTHSADAPNPLPDPYRLFPNNSFHTQEDLVSLGGNLFPAIYDPSFEEWTSAGTIIHWSSSYSQPKTQSTDSLDGSYSLQWNRTGGYQSNLFNTAGPETPVVSGKSYRASGWIKNIRRPGSGALIAINDDYSGIISGGAEKYGNACTSTDWSFSSIAFTTIGSGNIYVFFISLNDGQIPGQVARFDNVDLREYVPDVFVIPRYDALADSTDHAHSAATVTVDALFTVRDIFHAHSTTTIDLAHHGPIISNDSTHAHSVEEPLVSLFIDAQDSTHTCPADTPSLTQHNIVISKNAWQYPWDFSFSKNLFPNYYDPSFEQWTGSDLDKWAAPDNGSIAATAGRISGYALKFTCDDSAPAGSIAIDAGEVIPVTNLKNYRISGWVKTTANPQLGVKIYAYGQPIFGLTSASDYSTPATTAEWEELSFYVPVQADGYIQVYPVFYNDSGTPGQVSLVDDLSVNEIVQPVPLAQNYGPLTVNDSEHNHNVDALSFLPAYATAESCTHAHSADTIEIVQHLDFLPTNDSEHSWYDFDDPELTEHALLTIVLTEHAHSVETVLLYGVDIEVLNSTHAQSANQPQLIQHNALFADNAEHSHSAEALLLAVNLVTDDSTHGHTVDATELTQHAALQIGLTAHDQQTTAVAFTQYNILSSQTAIHVQSPEQPSLAEHTQIISANATQTLSFFSFEPDLIPNGNMEVDSSWLPIGSPDLEQQSSEQAHTGTYSWKVVESGTSGGIKSASYPIESSRSYKSQLWYYSGYDDAELRVSFYDGTGTLKSQHIHDLAIIQWTPLIHQVDMDSGDGGDNARIELLLIASGAVYFDDVSFQAITATLSLTQNANIEVQLSTHTQSLSDQILFQSSILNSKSSQIYHKVRSYGTTNFIFNSECNETYGWYGYPQASLYSERSSEQARNGSYSWKIGNATTKYAGVRTDPNYTVFNFENGKRYNIKFSVYPITDITLSLESFYLDSWAFNRIQIYYSPPIPDQWNDYDFEYLHYRQTTGNIDFGLQLIGPTWPLEDQIFYFDSVTVRECFHVPSLTTHDILAISDCIHSHSTVSVNLFQEGSLPVQDAQHDLVSDVSALIQHHIAGAQSSAHDNPFFGYGSNLAYLNPGFESWDSPSQPSLWDFSSAVTIAQSTDRYAGSYAAKIISDSNSDYGYINQQPTEGSSYYIPIEVGELYQVSAWFKIESNLAGGIRAELISGYGNFPPTTTDFVTASTWTYAETYTSAPYDDGLGQATITVSNLSQTSSQIALADNYAVRKVINNVLLATHGASLIQSAQHAHESQEPVLTQANILADLNSEHSQSASTPQLTQYHIIASTSSTHEHTGPTSSILVQHYTLDGQSAEHAHGISALSLIAHAISAAENTTHDHSADNIDIYQKSQIVVSNSTHAQSSDNVNVFQLGTLVIHSSTHLHSIETLILTQDHDLYVSDATFDHSVDSDVPLTQHATLLSSNAVHDTISINVNIFQTGSLPAQDSLHSVTSDSPALSGHGQIESDSSEHIFDFIGYGNNLFTVNSDFENWTGNVADGWKPIEPLYGSLAATTDSYTGTYAAKVKTNPGYVHYLEVDPDPSYPAAVQDGETYRIRAAFKVIQNPGVGARINTISQYGKFSPQSTPWVTASDWTVNELFISPQGGDDNAGIRFVFSNSGNSFYQTSIVDSLEIRQIINDVLLQHFYYTLSVAVSEHGQSSQPVALAQNYTISVDNTEHVSASQTAGLTQHALLLSDNSTHEHSVQNVSPTQHAQLIPNNCLHLHNAEFAELKQNHTLTSENSFQGAFSESLVLLAHNVISSANAFHTQTSSIPNLIYTPATFADTVFHNQTIDKLTLIQHNNISTNDSTHGQTANTPNLTENFIQSALSAQRQYIDRSFSEPLQTTSFTDALIQVDFDKSQRTVSFSRTEVDRHHSEEQITRSFSEDRFVLNFVKPAITRNFSQQATVLNFSRPRQTLTFNEPAVIRSFINEEV